ncbi:MAG: hypothetical protein F2706_00365, partial [Actinobacteria bacterium]|nr:hypothetical protein [Actinomycetota bacterium]
MRKVSKFPIVIALVVALFAGLTYLLAWSNIFTVSSIAIDGAPTAASKETISKVADLRTGDKLARVEPRA